MGAVRQRGVAAIEFAILLIPLLIIVFGMTELGRAVYYYNQAVVSTRDAARYLSMQGSGEGEAEARCLAVYGRPACEGEPLVHGLTPDMVNITYEASVDTGHGSINLVRVSIEGYPYASLVPGFVRDFVFGPISCSMRQAGT